ncbi:MAG: DUF4166 domain-containing protein [Sphingomicrobium sp.]
MRIESRAAGNVIPFRRPARPDAQVGDLRFRTLVGEDAWMRLPEAVRARFGRHIGDCTTILYAGEIVECRMSRAGWLLAQLARLIGSPLPLRRDIFVPAAVSVTEDVATGGQFWTRIYGRADGFPQVIHSAKRFAGPTGLEEYVGCGVTIALKVSVENGSLHFDSDHYALRIGRIRVRVPKWLEPGRMRVSHVDCNHGCFAFVLSIRHPLFGELICQTAMFEDCVTGASR